MHSIMINVRIVAHSFVSTISNDVINLYWLLLPQRIFDMCGLMCAAVYASFAIT